MKTAYELAMERLNKSAPIARLTGQQKKEIAELESKCKARLAEREITLKGEMEKAVFKGDAEEYEKLSQQLAKDRTDLQAELEAKKEQVRRSSS